MPFIHVKANCPISKETEKELIREMGDALSYLHKDSRWMMTEFEENRRLSFQGDDKTPACHVHISIFGSASKEPYEKLTKAVCDALQKNLSVSPDRVYVQYTETMNWGWNGSNF